MKKIENTKIYKFIIDNTNLKVCKNNKFIFTLDGKVVLELLLNKRLGRIIDVKLKLSETTYIGVEKFMDMINYVSYLRFKKIPIKKMKYFIGADMMNCTFIHENKWVKSNYNYNPPPIASITISPTLKKVSNDIINSSIKDDGGDAWYDKFGFPHIDYIKSKYSENEWLDIIFYGKGF